MHLVQIQIMVQVVQVVQAVQAEMRQALLAVVQEKA